MDMPGDMNDSEGREAVGVSEGSDAVGGEPSPRLVPHGRKDLVEPETIDPAGLPKRDPFITSLLRRDHDERSPSTLVCEILLVPASVFLAWKAGKWAFDYVASGHDNKFTPTMAWPVGLAGGFIIACVIMGIATQLKARERRIFAVLIVILALWRAF